MNRLALTDYRIRIKLGEWFLLPVRTTTRYRTWSNHLSTETPNQLNIERIHNFLCFRFVIIEYWILNHAS